MLDEYYQACISFTLISLNSLISRVTIVTLCRKRPRMSVLLRTFLFFLALQPILGLYFAALSRGYSLLAYDVS